MAKQGPEGRAWTGRPGVDWRIMARLRQGKQKVKEITKHGKTNIRGGSTTS
jgi:hypothetical protein